MAGDEQPPTELGERLLFSMMKGVALLARALNVPLSSATRLLELAYFQELRHAGFTHREASERLEISMRTAARLAKALKSDFFRPEMEHELPKQIEFMLWGEPMTLRRIRQHLPNEDREAVDDAVARLVAESRIIQDVENRTPRFRVAQSSDRLVGESWQRRIGGLNALVRNLSQTAIARFVQNDANAFARNLSVRLSPARVAEIQQLYERSIWEPLRAWDEEAIGKPDRVPVTLSIYWSVEGEDEDE